MITLNAAEAKNVLAAYIALKGNTPFFSFNSETQAIVDKLTAATQEDVEPIKFGNKSADGC